MAARPAFDRKEALRLARMYRHVSFGTVVLGVLLLTGVLSMVSMVWAYGPINPIP